MARGKKIDSASGAERLLLLVLLFALLIGAGFLISQGQQTEITEGPITVEQDDDVEQE